MEPAKIDWKMVESIFEEDKLYENINAPQWVDFLNPLDPHLDDESWFCRPDCKHPKTAEDFFRTTPSKKFLCSAEKFKTPFANWNLRDAKLKRRGQSQRSSEDGENQNPNLSTPPPTYQVKLVKEMIKSSTEKKKPVDDVSQNNETPKLKSTLSARNLFAGKDILGHISEFCNELKKMASRAREAEGDEKLIEQESSVEAKNDVKGVNEVSREVLGEIDLKAKERKPLLEVCKARSEGVGKGVKDKQRRLKAINDAENTPSPLNLENVKREAEQRLLNVRTNPPSPQCFSGTREPNKTTPSKALKSRAMERGVLQEVKQEESEGKGYSIVDGKEARALDVFWFLKPCTLSST
ncbi:hypothetical protein M5689_001260 [Euphorbia peplus]|nr:hypothetical protein M5689_001260 [Euphorbia peplus]